MDINEMMQYISYALMAIGVMAFFVSVITEVVKSWPGLEKLPTSSVVIVLSMAHDVCVCHGFLYCGAGGHGRLGAR